MSAVAADFASRITQAHKAAEASLRDALANAIHAGELLIEAKATLPHGSFGDFCASLPFAETTARGYMRLARLDPVNRQRVADLPLRAALLELAEARPQKQDSVSASPGLPQPTPAWTPKPGHWHMFNNSEAAFHVVPALGYPGWFHVSKLFSDSEGESYWDGTLSPIPRSAVARLLQELGLNEPGSAEWDAFERPGLSEAFGIPAIWSAPAVSCPP